MPSDTNIVEFPENMMLQWLPYERLLGEWLGADSRNTPDMIADLLSKIRPVFLTQARAADEFAQGLPPELDPLARIQQWVAALSFGLMKDLLNRLPAEERFDYVQNWVASVTLGLMKEITRREMG